MQPTQSPNETDDDDDMSMASTEVSSQFSGSAISAASSEDEYLHPAFHNIVQSTYKGDGYYAEVAKYAKIYHFYRKDKNWKIILRDAKTYMDKNKTTRRLAIRHAIQQNKAIIKDVIHEEEQEAEVASMDVESDDECGEDIDYDSNIISMAYYEACNKDKPEEKIKESVCEVLIEYDTIYDLVKRDGFLRHIIKQAERLSEFAPSFGVSIMNEILKNKYFIDSLYDTYENGSEERGSEENGGAKDNQSYILTNRLPSCVTR